MKLKIHEKRKNRVGILNSLLKGTATVLNAVADRGSATIEDRVVKSVRHSMMKDGKLQFALIAFKDRYNFGLNCIDVKPKIDETTLNITGWVAEANDKIIIQAQGLDELYSFFAKGVMTTDPEEVLYYKKVTKTVLS